MDTRNERSFTYILYETIGDVYGYMDSLINLCNFERIKILIKTYLYLCNIYPNSNLQAMKFNSKIDFHQYKSHLHNLFSISKS